MSDNLSANTKSIHEIRRNNGRLKNIHEDFLKCEFCNKIFTQAGSLRRHIKTIHKGHKDFQWRPTKLETTGVTLNYETLISRLFETFRDFSRLFYTSRPKNKWCHGTTYFGAIGNANTM